jgi:hypothetical protein
MPRLTLGISRVEETQIWGLGTTQCFRIRIEERVLLDLLNKEREEPYSKQAKDQVQLSIML